MVDFLMNSELTESKAFMRSFVKEISVAPDTATIHYTIPIPEDIAVPGKAALGGRFSQQYIVVPPAGLEPTHLAPEASALSSELRGLEQLA